MISMLQMRNGSSERWRNFLKVTKLESGRVRIQIEVWNYQKPLQDKHTQSYPNFGDFANFCLSLLSVFSYTVMSYHILFQVPKYSIQTNSVFIKGFLQNWALCQGETLKQQEGKFWPFAWGFQHADIFKDVTCFVESYCQYVCLRPPTAGGVEGGRTYECSLGPRAWHGAGPE